MSTMDKKVESVKVLQAELDHRTEVENRAIQLISECRFQEATELLKTLDDSAVKDEWEALFLEKDRR